MRVHARYVILLLLYAAYYFVYVNAEAYVLFFPHETDARSDRVDPDIIDVIGNRVQADDGGAAVDQTILCYSRSGAIPERIYGFRRFWPVENPAWTRVYYRTYTRNASRSRH